MISALLRQVDEICTLLRDCGAYSDNSLRTFRDDTSVPSSRVKKFKIVGNNSEEPRFRTATCFGLNSIIKLSIKSFVTGKIKTAVKMCSHGHPSCYR